MQLDVLNTRIWLKGLAMECPLCKPLADCPLNGVRCLPASQMNRTMNRLSDKSVQAIADYHQYCFEQRTEHLAQPASLSRKLG